MKISVVIPVYNAQETILGCLRSLNEQEVLPYEVILVDNNSTDNSIKKVEEELPRLNNLKLLIISEAKKGPASSRNKGIRTATGDIVAFIDSDCIADKDWIKNINGAFQDDMTLEAIGGVDTYSLSNININLIGKFLAAYWLAIPQKLNRTLISRKEDFLEEKFISTFNCAFRKEILLELNGFDETFSPAGEDMDIWMRALERKARIIAWDSTIAVCHQQNISLKSMSKKAFIYGEALSHLTKKHFRNKIILQIPYIGLKEFKRGFFTILICANIFKFFCITGIIMIGVLLIPAATRILIALLLITLALHNKSLVENKNLKISLVENIMMIFLFILREFSEEFGRIYGSFKHKIICI